MANHKIKIKEEYYTEITNGNKTFELRKNDRDYQEGDTIEFIVLKENGEQKTSSRIYKITYILKGVPEYGLADGFCIFSIREL